jgi:hypothetical protein
MQVPLGHLALLDQTGPPPLSRRDARMMRREEARADPRADGARVRDHSSMRERDS